VLGAAGWYSDGVAARIAATRRAAANITPSAYCKPRALLRLPPNRIGPHGSPHAPDRVAEVASKPAQRVATLCEPTNSGMGENGD
ncbi:MAG: hypothetical protein M3O70_13865, partial [Actinomycetota bacterium]|nr:hypothetical protein [Actinomycetota bacterium]